MYGMKPLPFNAGEMNMADMPDHASTMDSLRQFLKQQGDARWMLGDDELANEFSMESTVGKVSQPSDDRLTFSQLSLREMAHVINARRLFPDYLPDIIIPPETVQSVLALQDDQKGGLSIPPAIQSNIPDMIAIDAINAGNRNLPIPATFNPYSSMSTRRKMSYPSAMSAYPQNVLGMAAMGRMPGHILVSRSLNLLSPFSAFADDPSIDGSGSDAVPSTSDAAGMPGGSISYDSTGATDVGSNPTDSTSSGASFGTSLMNALPSLITGASSIIAAQRGPGGSSVPIGASRAYPTAAPPVNWTPILLVGGGLVALAIFMGMGRRGGRRR